MFYKIGFLLPNLDNLGGITVSVLTIANALEKIGHEIHLFPVGLTKEKETDKVHSINSNLRYKQLSLFMERYEVENKKKKFDLLVSNNRKTDELLSKTNLSHTLMIIHNGAIIKKRDFLTHFRDKIYFKKIYHEKNIAFVSECLKDAFLEKFTHIKPIESFVIYNSINIETLNTLSLAYSISTFSNYIVCVGRLEKDKNQEMLIRAMQKVKDKKLQLLIIGAGSDEKRLKRLTTELKLTQRVHFLGWLFNPYPYIKDASLLASVSKIEGMPMNLLEALALKTPIISTNIKCGPNEIFIDELTEFLVKSNDIDDLVMKINKALTAYPKIEEKYIHTFKVDNVARHYLSVISKVIENCNVKSQNKISTNQTREDR